MENMMIEDQYLTLKTDLNELKANGGRPPPPPPESEEEQQTETKPKAIDTSPDEVTKGQEQRVCPSVTVYDMEWLRTSLLIRPYISFSILFTASTVTTGISH